MLTLKNIHKFFVEDKEKTAIAALIDISIDFRMQKTSVIVGPSGCGKTTLIKVMAGLISPEEGDIFFHNQLISIKDLRKRMSYVDQYSRIYPHLTVFDNIAFPLKNEGVFVDEIKNRVYEMAKQLDLSHLLSRNPKQLSGGQQQKVALAKAMIKLPEIILLDEPFSNLDLQTRLELKKILMDIKQTFKTTIVMVTHQLDEVLEIADDIVYMDNGEIINIERG